MKKNIKKMTYAELCAERDKLRKENKQCYSLKD